MPIWLATAAGWIGQRFLHFLVYTTLAGLVVAASWGFVYKLFFKDTTKQTFRAPVTNYNYTQHYSPFSCARINPIKPGGSDGK